MFGYENESVFPIYVSDQKFEERIAQEDKKDINNLNYDGIEFPGQEKDFSKIEKKNNICINVFCYEDKLIFQITFQFKNLKIRWIYCWQLIKTSSIICI